MGKIAFVGAPGSGKTVLLTVLTKKFAGGGQKIQFIPDSLVTTKYIADKWNQLKEGEWPAPTPPVKNPPLYSWCIKQGSLEENFVTSDIAGEAWMSFINENVDESDPAAPASSASQFKSYKENWEKILDFMNSPQSEVAHQNKNSLESLLLDASGVAVVINLACIINQEPGYEGQMWLPMAIQKFLAKHGHANTPVAILLSQCDRYAFLPQDQQKVLNGYLPSAANFNTVFRISAVADTFNGRPKQDFTSIGLKELVEWMLKVIHHNTIWLKIRKMISGLLKACFLLVIVGITVAIISSIMNYYKDFVPPQSVSITQIQIDSYGKWDSPNPAPEIYVKINDQQIPYPIEKNQYSVTIPTARLIHLDGKTSSFKLDVYDKDIIYDEHMGPSKYIETSWGTSKKGCKEKQTKSGTVYSTDDKSKYFNYTITLEATY